MTNQPKQTDTVLSRVFGDEALMEVNVDLSPYEVDIVERSQEV